MPDQADKLRQLVSDTLPCAAPRRALPASIVVTGGKGGVGTTTVALNLAVALSTGGHRTVLVDAASHPDAAQLADVDTSIGPCLAEVLVGAANACDALREGPAGLQLLASRWPAGATDHSPRTVERLVAQLHSLGDEADILVIDSGSGPNAVARRLWQAASLVVLATTPDDTAVIDAYGTIKAGNVDAPDADIRLLINRCDDASQADDVHRRVATAGHRFLRVALGRAPRLPQLANHPYASMTVPRAWDQTHTPFARSVHQLSRFAADVLAQRRWQADASTTFCPNATDLTVPNQTPDFGTVKQSLEFSKC